MRSLLSAINQRTPLISDGAWGTFLHQYGLKPGDCPELWNVTHRDQIYAIGKSYIDAGSDMILTNSFGGSPIKLKHYGLDNRTAELNEAAAAISRDAAGDEHLVLASVGPTGVMLMMGEVSENELFDGFSIQAEALEKGGADVICVETMSAIDEACIAIRAAKQATDLEIACTFTFEKTANGEYRTMMGVSPSDMVDAVIDAGASIIGSNCGNGFDQMVGILQEIRKVDQKTPVLIHANAGIPVYKNGETVFPETPDMMASKARDLIEAGAQIIGGCCGTTPEHIKALVNALKN